MGLSLSGFGKVFVLLKAGFWSNAERFKLRLNGVFLN
jgi:hypothetical protein